MDCMEKLRQMGRYNGGVKDIEFKALQFQLPNYFVFETIKSGSFKYTVKL